MACGIPTIVPDKGAHAEFIPVGTAFLVKSTLTNCTVRRGEAQGRHAQHSPAGAACTARPGRQSSPRPTLKSSSSMQKSLNP